MALETEMTNKGDDRNDSSYVLLLGSDMCSNMKIANRGHGSDAFSDIY
jgi:hypothetical protein